MIKVSFIFNGYNVECSGEDIRSVELDIIESRVMLHSLPPAVHPVQPGSSQVTTLPEVGKQGGPSVSAADHEIIPVTKITEEKTRNGSKMYKIIGGKYDAYGVALYPDTCLFKDGIVPTMIMNEVVSGLEALIITQDGKKRVAALRRKAASV